MRKMDWRRVLSPVSLLILCIALLITSFRTLKADELSFELSLKDHRFTPSELTIPADKRVRLTIENLDRTAAEFESHDFKAEKVVPAGGEVSLYLGPLKPGSYSFFDDFRASETRGTLIAK